MNSGLPMYLSDQDNYSRLKSYKLYFIRFKALRLCFVTGLLLAGTFGFAQDKPYQKEINNFLKKDSIQAPEQGAILFTGSSSIVMWKSLQEDFPGKNVLNRGFGGSSLPHLLMYADDIIFPYNPSQIVLYSGENDIAAGADARLTYDRFRQVFELIRGRLPQVPITFISIKPSPSRKQFRPVVDSANAMIRQYLKGQRRTSYVDVYSKMLDKNNNPRADIFLRDSLHMNENGYKIWKKAVAPHLKNK